MLYLLQSTDIILAFDYYYSRPCYFKLKYFSYEFAYCLSAIYSNVAYLKLSHFKPPTMPHKV